MNKIKQFFEFPLIELSNFQLTPYNLFTILFIISFCWIFLWVLKKILLKQKLRRKINKGQQYAIYQIIKYILIVIAIAITLESVGIKITILLAGSAALLVGLGLGLQNTFNDLVSGIILLFEGTIKVEDVVEVEGIVGRVKRIGIRTSEIQTRDNIVIIMPNSRFVTEKVINWSHNEKLTRFNVQVGVSYESDVKLVKKVLLECVKEHDEISNTPAPFIRFIDYGDSALIFELFFWTEKIMPVEDTKSDLRFIINKKFRENNIEIPFPQRDIHIRSTKIPLK